MLLDEQCILSDKQAVTVTAPSTHVMDLTAAGDACPGALHIYCKVDETFAGLTALKVTLQTADNSAFTGASELMSLSFVAADLKAGKCLFAAAVPKGCKRFVRAQYSVTGTGTAGKVSLFFTGTVEQN